ncbi:SoxS protein [Paracoccus sp. (in: a-proteobacteria)]|uniref:SoxS protein n=1 Tax=Paracoccus sp. TaxID=267 RepID=UPI0026DFC9B2|nr:SoxS protein [Paracoccus sp. (in: a-proteobacteria)]MDO5647185.1 SoxS protein [Paracoccus sp. (in: a-proteobacteria)]
MHSSITRRALILGLSALPLTARATDPRAQPVQLMMVTSRGCYYCAQWEQQIGPGYAASPAGRIAPLFRVDRDGPFPDGLALDRRPWITPTFILLKSGLELSRIEGYVGQNHFYPVLNNVIAQAGLMPRQDPR